MNGLINVTLDENHEPVVSGRQLHKALGVKTAYKDWFPRMTEYGFAEGEDFSSFLSKSTGGRPSQDHIIKLDMAKEIAMIQRTDKGKEVRTYFIQVGKDGKPHSNMTTVWTQLGRRFLYERLKAIDILPIIEQED